MGEALTAPSAQGLSLDNSCRPTRTRALTGQGILPSDSGSLGWDGTWSVTPEMHKGYSHRASLGRSTEGAALLTYVVPSDVAERTPNSERS